MKKHVDRVLQHRRVKQVIEHLLGPLGSILIHILVIALAIRFIVFTTDERTPPVEVVVMEPHAVEMDDFPEDPVEPEELFELPDVPPLDLALDFDHALPDPVAEPVAAQADLDLSAFAALEVQSPLVMRGLYANRGAQGRAAAVGRHGGRWGPQTDEAVNKALEWLRRNQNADGSWSAAMSGRMGTDMRIGITGLCLLAFLAHGEIPASEKYGGTVEKAIRYLADRQTDSGHFISTDDPINAPYKVGTYGQAIATYAISEAYALTRVPRLRTAMERAVDVIMKGQQPGGGWFYRYEKSTQSNNSVSGWQMQALKAAHLAGARNPGLKDALDRAAAFVKGRQHPDDGMFYYIGTAPGSRRDVGNTAVAVLCLQLLGHADSREARNGLRSLRAASVDWDEPPSWPMSVWYYVTQAMFHQGGPAWAAWNDTFAPVYIQRQNSDGSWTSPARQGANIPFGYEHPFGPAFSTAMSALTLMVYYRFLPTYQAGAVEPASPVREELRVEIL
jgi:prenyltransferase beta subunit